MTVKDLIEALGNMPPDAKVYAFDPGTETDEQVTGMVLDQGADGVRSVTLCTSDD